MKRKKLIETLEKLKADAGNDVFVEAVGALGCDVSEDLTAQAPCQHSHVERLPVPRIHRLYAWGNTQEEAQAKVMSRIIKKLEESRTFDCSNVACNNDALYECAVVLPSYTYEKIRETQLNFSVSRKGDGIMWKCNYRGWSTELEGRPPFAEREIELVTFCDCRPRVI